MRPINGLIQWIELILSVGASSNESRKTISGKGILCALMGDERRRVRSIKARQPWLITARGRTESCSSANHSRRLNLWNVWEPLCSLSHHTSLSSSPQGRNKSSVCLPPQTDKSSWFLLFVDYLVFTLTPRTTKQHFKDILMRLRQRILMHSHNFLHFSLS